VTRRPLIAATIALWLTAPAAFAQSVDRQVTSTTSVRWHTDDDHGELFERLNAGATQGAWTLGTRLDLSSFTGTEETDDRYQDDLALEKMYLRWSAYGADVTAGDSYVSFGRGLALSVRKLDELGSDTTVRGANITWRGRDHSLAVVAGVSNINNVDEASGRRAGDTLDVITGMRGQLRLDSGYTLGAHGVLVAFRDPLVMAVPGEPVETYADRWIMVGPTFDAPRLSDRLGVYAEAIGQLRDIGDRGYGLYGSATYRDGRASWLFELKAYGDLDVVRPTMEASEFDVVQYNSAPTLERVGQQLEHAQRNTLGARARADWRYSSSLLAFANLAVARDYDGYPILIDDDTPPLDMAATITDPYAGAETRWDDARSLARVTLGWRTVVADMTGDRVRGDRHIELDVTKALAPRVGLELHAQHNERLYYHPPLIKERYREGTVQASLRWAPVFAIGAIYDYTTQAQQPKTSYVSATAEWRPSAAFQFRAQAGASRGGLKCVSGVCRELPPFEGIKLTATLRR
jgi:hypothetical protein